MFENYDDQDTRMKVEDQEFDQVVRQGFIRKVFGILSIQLLFTTFLCLISMSSPSFLLFQAQHSFIFALCCIGAIAVPLGIICFPDAYRKVPTNYCLLAIFTFCESYLVSFICGASNPALVFMAAVMTTGIVISLTFYAYWTKTDFTMMGGALFLAGMCMLLISIFMMFTQNKMLHILFSAAGVFLGGIYLIYDMQLILGKGVVRLDSDDYVFAAIMLYSDIIYIFVKILEILQYLNKD